MKPWHERPPEIAYQYNPAFLGELIFRFCAAYMQKGKTGVPYPVFYVVLPLVLFKDTRSTIQPKSHRQLRTWITKNPHATLHLPQRARQLVPYFKEALMLLLSTGRITVERNLLVPQEKCRPVGELFDHAMLHYYAKAEALGRWCGTETDEVSIYIMLGVKP